MKYYIRTLLSQFRLLNDKVSYEEKEEYAMNDQAMTDVLKAYDQFLQ